MTEPTYQLELKASEERQRIQHSMQDLKRCMRDALDLNRAVREHVTFSWAAAALISATAGYLLAGAFVRPRWRLW